MKTELGFLLELLIEHKLPRQTKLICLERIKEVEQGLAIPRPQTAPMVVRPPASSRMPSEQSIDAAVGMPANPPTINMAPIAPVIPAAQRIVGGEVNNGDGTRGKKKW